MSDDDNGLKGSDLKAAKAAKDHLTKAIASLNEIDDGVREENGDLDDAISQLETALETVESAIGDGD